MRTEKVLYIALAVSLATHGIIMAQHFNFGSVAAQKTPKVQEISYVKPEKETKPLTPVKNITPKKHKEELLKLPGNIAAQKTGAAPPAFMDSNVLAANKGQAFRPIKDIPITDPAFSKPSFSKPDIISVKKKITFPPVDLDKISNPTYVSYYQIVREKIRRAAYDNYTQTEEGEVYCSFVVSSNGDLVDVRLVEERSRANDYLKETTLASIKDAAPFPVFPKDLDYPQLSFNIVISFEIE